jgi:hypothetical protein
MKLEFAHSDVFFDYPNFTGFRLEIGENTIRFKKALPKRFKKAFFRFGKIT